MKKKRLLILCVDIDDDLGEKAGVYGPVVGRKANIEAATKLAVKDPEDSDVNTIFEAVKLYDDLGKENPDIEIATITGSARLGYYADQNIVKQLEKVQAEFSPQACIFVSDGASDEQLIPLVHSRVKVESVRAVTVKQTRELEKTYVVLLDKLREPHFARIVFGIPGIALLLFAFSEFIGIRLLLGILGGYLLLKGLGVEDFILRGISGVKFSTDDQTFIFSFVAFLLAIVSVVLGANAALQPGLYDPLKQVAFFIKGLFPLFPIALLTILVGDVLNIINRKKTYLLPKRIIFGSSLLLFWLITNNAAEWVIGNISFAEFFLTLFLGVVAMYLFTILSTEFKKRIISRLQLEGKEVYTEIGGFVGKVVGINKKKETFIIQTSTGQKIDLDFEHISDFGEKIIIRY